MCEHFFVCVDFNSEHMLSIPCSGEHLFIAWLQKKLNSCLYLGIGVASSSSSPSSLKMEFFAFNNIHNKHRLIRMADTLIKALYS